MTRRAKDACCEIEPPQTLGQYRVGCDFNPSGNDMVDKLKRAAAAFIDECENVRKVLLYDDAGIQPKEGESATAFELRQAKHFDRKTEVRACLQRAMEQAEDAAMWAVKGATKRDRRGDYLPGADLR